MSSSTRPCITLQQLPAVQAATQPEGIALWWQDAAITYSALNSRVLATAARLGSTGTRGDRVAILAWNCPEFVELLYAVPASGRILVPLNARLAAAELIYQLESAGVSILFADPTLLQPLVAHPDFPQKITVIDLQEEFEYWRHSGPETQLPQSDPDDPVWILYTSGSTGRPKGAVLTHRSFLAGLDSAALGRPVDPNDRYLYPFPLFHVAAHNVLLQHQYGAAVVLTRSFDPAETLRACRDLRITTMSLAPTMIAMLLDHPDFCPDHLATVRTIGYGASAMPETLLQRLLSETPVGLCQSYGMTELSGSAAFLTVADHQLATRGRPELLKSVGKPLPSVDIKLINSAGEVCAAGESGEILVKAQQCMLGYWNQADATASAIDNGWLHTGDIGCFDDQGYLYIVDRKKDMIISGGENIASREIEEVLRNHPAVRDCAIIGQPHSRWGEMVVAVVVLQDKAGDRELAAHCRQYLAPYKTPRRWIPVDSLPLNAAGKVDKPALKQAHI